MPGTGVGQPRAGRLLEPLAARLHIHGQGLHHPEQQDQAGQGDAGDYVERRLLEQGAVRGPVSVLISGHHGLGKSADPRFLASLRPRVAVIAASWKVPRFQPNDAVVARLRAASGRLLRTDEDGEICLELAADSLAPEDC